jgi:5-methylcytosine-specific restriction endonuclease McrA
MPEPVKESLDSFPIWKPLRKTKSMFNSRNFRERLHALRIASSGFTKRKDVREIIFNRDNRKCKICNSTNNLEIDHVISVYAVAKGFLPINMLNTEINLQTLCHKCNLSKPVV